MAGYKAAKYRLTLRVGGNASGNMKLKPLLIYHSEPTSPEKHSQGLSSCCVEKQPQSLVTARFPGRVFPLYPRGRDILCGEGRPIQHSLLTMLQATPAHGQLSSQCRSSACHSSSLWTRETIIDFKEVLLPSDFSSGSKGN